MNNIVIHLQVNQRKRKIYILKACFLDWSEITPKTSGILLHIAIFWLMTSEVIFNRITKNNILYLKLDDLVKSHRWLDIFAKVIIQSPSAAQ